MPRNPSGRGLALCLELVRWVSRGSRLQLPVSTPRDFTWLLQRSQGSSNTGSTCHQWPPGPPSPPFTTSQTVRLRTVSPLSTRPGPRPARQQPNPFPSPPCFSPVERPKPNLAMMAGRGEPLRWGIDSCSPLEILRLSGSLLHHTSEYNPSSLGDAHKAGERGL